MPAYRFCRTDDIPFLVDALNAGYAIHFPDRPRFSIDDFKREIRELNVWCSSCMVASVDRGPIAVVTGAKREHETLIHRVGVHPDFQRQGHARHLLESLSQKLSVLGPPRLVSELPDDQPAVRALFECVGYRAEQKFADFELRGPLAPPPVSGEVSPASLEQLLRSEALSTRVARSWERALETLANRKDQVRGLAIASDRRVEACALYRDLPQQGRREIVAVGGGGVHGDESAEARVLREIAIRAACQAGALVVTIPRISQEEFPWAELESMGFARGRTYTRYAMVPGAGAA